jgi:hypothetical protein
MHIAKESIDDFKKQFMLPFNDYKQINSKTKQTGILVIVLEPDITELLNIYFPKVLSNIINDYFNMRIDVNYTLTYPHSTGQRNIILTITCKTLSFRHSVYCGSFYNVTEKYYSKFRYVQPDITCPIDSKIQNNTDDDYTLYNNNIISNKPIPNYICNIGLLFDFILDQKKTWISHFLDNPIFTTINYKKDNNITLKYISNDFFVLTRNETNYDINIVNEYGLNRCISIHKILFEMLHDIIDVYR